MISTDEKQVIQNEREVSYMKRKLLACVLACTMVASLAGCGGSASQTATESKPAETTAAEQSQAAESTAPQKKQQQKQQRQALWK